VSILEATQTVGGYPVRIYATDGEHNVYPIHGAINNGKGWMLAQWTINGRYVYDTETFYDLDLTNSYQPLAVGSEANDV